MKKVRGVRIDNKKDGSEVKIYFCPRQFDPNQDSLRDAVNSAIFYGHASGCELSRHRFGEIRIYFNPLYHKKKDRQKATRKLLNAITAAPVKQYGLESDFEEDDI